jgi:hypothetical protein
VGEIAYMDGSQGVIATRNPFNLESTTLRFTPGPSGYDYESVLGAFPLQPDNPGEPIALADDDARAVALPFEFPFFGVNRSSIWIHSDGNLTFQDPDAGTSARSLGRFTAGPPRIAALFSDLDPSQDPNSVRIASSPESFTVTWLATPTFSSTGSGPTQTFRARLFPDGRIELAWARITAQEAVVGITPGRLAASTQVVAFLTASGNAAGNGIAERFTSNDAIDIVRASQRFYETHDDAYDFLVFFNSAGVPVSIGALASETTVRSYRQGIGDAVVDNGAIFGSPRRLQSVINMGPVTQYPEDPYTTVGLRGRLTGDTTMSIIGHEAGHLFLALASIRVPDNPDARPMLGGAGVHWAFSFNSEASLLEGNRLRDNGDGTFTSVATVESYSPLDQYLMGLRAPWEVPATFVVSPASVSQTRLPQRGVTFLGTRIEVPVDRVIAAEGRRVPDHTVAQSRFRFAFVVIGGPGEEPNQQVIGQVERYRSEYPLYFKRVTDERGEADTALKSALTISAFPAAGLVVNESSPVTVSIPRANSRDVGIGIHKTDGRIMAPQSVTIPAGQTSVTFDIQGLSDGPADLVLQAWLPDDSREPARDFAPVFVRIAVQPSNEPLILQPYYTEGPVVFRVTDANDIPYANVPIAIESTGELGFIPGFNQQLRTMENGLLFLNWTPGADGPQSLTASIPGSASAPVTITRP